MGDPRRDRGVHRRRPGTIQGCPNWRSIPNMEALHPLIPADSGKSSLHGHAPPAHDPQTIGFGTFVGAVPQLVQQPPPQTHELRRSQVLTGFMQQHRCGTSRHVIVARTLAAAAVSSARLGRRRGGRPPRRSRAEVRRGEYRTEQSNTSVYQQCRLNSFPLEGEWASSLASDDCSAVSSTW